MDLYGLSIHQNLAAFLRIRAENRTCRFCTACTHQSRDPDDLTRMGFEADVAYHAPRIQIANFKNGLANRCLDTRELFFDVAAHHIGNDRIQRRIFKVHARDILSIAHNGHTIDNMLQFFQTMRNIDDAAAFVTELADDTEKLVDLLRSQRGSRFVHDKHPCLMQKCFRDLDHLLFRHRKRSNQCFRLDFETQPLQNCSCLIVHLFPLDHAAFDNFLTQEDIFSYAQV